VNDLRAVAAALGAAGDALARGWVNGDGSGVGLRGGSFRYTTAGNRTAFELDALRFTADLPVSGQLVWDLVANEARASLLLPEGRLEARWPTRGSHARVSVLGQLQGRRIVATLPAP
ncbi:MAG: hypothetical protein WAQ05_09580, partial [Rubrivivax sp.]